MADFIQDDETPQPVTLWDEPDKFPAWRDCTFEEFMEHLQRAERERGIVWNQHRRAYSLERGTEARWN